MRNHLVLICLYAADMFRRPSGEGSYLQERLVMFYAGSSSVDCRSTLASFPMLV